jgi:hypothetical protein
MRLRGSSSSSVPSARSSTIRLSSSCSGSSTVGTHPGRDTVGTPKRRKLKSIHRQRADSFPSPAPDGRLHTYKNWRKHPPKPLKLIHRCYLNSVVNPIEHLYKCTVSLVQHQVVAVRASERGITKQSPASILVRAISEPRKTDTSEKYPAMIERRCIGRI